MPSTVLPWRFVSQQTSGEALNSKDLNTNYLMISFSNYLMITHNHRKVNCYWGCNMHIVNQVYPSMD